MLENSPEIVLLYVALGKLGAVSVPLNTAAKGELLAYYLKQSDSEMVIADAELVERLAPVTSQVSKLRFVVSLGGEANEKGAAVTGLALPRHDFGTLLDAAETPPQANVRFCDRTLIYTSGTTGPSKGEVSPHSHGLTCGVELAQAYGYRADDVLYICLPVFHGNAWLYTICRARGRRVGRDPAALLGRRLLGRHPRLRRDEFNALGAMANIIWQPPRVAARPRPPVRQAMMVPTPADLPTLRGRYGIGFTSVYAIGDCASRFGPRRPIRRPSRHAGGPARTSRSRSSTTTTSRCRAARPARSASAHRPAVDHAQGYYSMPEATARLRRNLWFHTGDRGSLTRTATSPSSTARRRRSAAAARTSPRSRSSRSS